MLPASYQKCPKHEQNDIVLICLLPACLEVTYPIYQSYYKPLCKFCCKLHVEWHNQVGTKAELEIIDTVRNNCYSDIHKLKMLFEEERAILHHFSNEGDGFGQRIQKKVEKVKQNLIQLVTDYCNGLEKAIVEKMKANQSQHPSLRKDLATRLDKVITDLDSQEKGIVQSQYMKGLIMVLMEERDHDLEGVQNEIDITLKEYLKGMFDVFVHDDHLNELKSSLQHYVAFEPAYLEDEIQEYQMKVREGKKVYGMDKQGNDTLAKDYSSRKPNNQIFAKPESKPHESSKNYETKLDQNTEKFGTRYAGGSRYGKL